MPRLGSKAAELERRVDRIAQTLQVVALDATSFRIWAGSMQGTSDDHTLDAVIAATAIARGLTVASRNVRGLDGFGVAVVNPFSVA
jgi:predicted nucleic acid-binding protein